MKPPLVAILLAGFLAVSAAAVVVVRVAPAASTHDHSTGADHAAMHGGMAGDDPHAQLGMERLRFHQATGSVPTKEQAQSLPQLSYVDIQNDTQFNPSHGVKLGSGTLEDPYVIQGYDVTGDLYIADTDACFEIRNNWIDGQLHLNWNGQCVFVHHNFIRDLRVNENNQRTGLDTGGLIELNAINYVGQIRHFDGEFRNNVVGPREDASLPEGIFHDPENVLPFAKDTRVLNIDGWNEALFHHNTIYGSTDLKLHGHHHSTGFLATHSHYHGDSEARDAHMEDHTNRWSSVSFADNQIVDPTGYGLRYTDEAHAGDDRTANSESNEMLEKDHQHHTIVDIRHNHLQGAGIVVDIFNAEDELHKVRNPGWLTIEENTIALTERQSGILGEVSFGPQYDQNTAIRVWEVKEVAIGIRNNVMTFQASDSTDPLAPATDPLNQVFPFLASDGTPPTAISLSYGKDAAIVVDANKATGFEYGVWATSFEKDATWAVHANDFGSSPNPVYYDDSVANKPTTSDPGPDPEPDYTVPEGAHDGHSH